MKLTGFIRRIARAIAGAPPSPPPPQTGHPPASSRETTARRWRELAARAQARKTLPEKRDPFALPEFPPGVKPTAPKIAMDDAFGGANGVNAWAGTSYGGLVSIFAEGQTFLGYAYLAELAQRPEYRRMVETIATEMTRKWIKIKGKGDEDGIAEKSAKISKIVEEMERLNVRDVFRKMLEIDGLFGRAHLYVDTGDTENLDELKTDIGDGTEKSAPKIGKGKLKNIKAIEPVWVYPIGYNSNNPLVDSWYKPTDWFVMGVQIHASRLIPLVGREVPDLLKPAYAFGGLALTQMAKPYVDNWLRTRQSVADIISAFSVFVLKTNLGSAVEDPLEAETIFDRADFFNAMRDNKGLMILDFMSEEFMNVAAPLGGLDALQAQSQEQMAAVSGIPLVKLLGITPHGLNASTDGEIRVFYDTIAAWQERQLRLPVQIIFGMAQLSLFGSIDDEIVFEFVPLFALTEKERAELQKLKGETGTNLIDHGVIDAEEERQRLASDEESDYPSIDVSDVPELLEEEEEGLEPEGGRPDPIAGKGGAGQAAPGKKSSTPPKKTKPDKGKGAAKGGPKGATDARGAWIARDDTFSEGDHPRGQPGNAGQWVAGGGGETGAKPSARSGMKETKSDGKTRTQADGSPLPEHIQKLKIPPAWTDVRYNDAPGASLIAVGKDAKGRVQSVYSAEHSAAQSAVKFARIFELSKKFAEVAAQNDQARKSTDPKTRDAADCLDLIMRMGVRPGSETDTGAEKKAYGATTLEGRHVVRDENGVWLQFVGKKGVALNLPVTDKGLAKMLEARGKAAGPDGQLFGKVSDSSLRDHVHSLDGGDFKTKDFRTYVGTSTAARLVAKMAPPKDEKAYKKAVMDVAKEVSRTLGNTAAIALQSYIAPQVFAEWRIAA